MAVAYRTLPPEPARTALLEALARALGEFFRDNLVSVVLFGSVARGEAEELSDVDLLIVCEELPGSRWKRYALFHQALVALKGMLEDLARQHYYPEFRPILKTRPQAEVHTPIYLDMVEDARMLGGGRRPPSEPPPDVVRAAGRRGAGAPPSEASSSEALRGQSPRSNRSLA